MKYIKRIDENFTVTETELNEAKKFYLIGNKEVSRDEVLSYKYSNPEKPVADRGWPKWLYTNNGPNGKTLEWSSIKKDMKDLEKKYGKGNVVVGGSTNAGGPYIEIYSKSQNESAVNESFVAYTENSKGEYEVVKILKDQRAAKAWRKKNAYLLDDDSVDVKSIGTTPKKDWDKTHPELATESVVIEGISVTDERVYGKKGIIIMIDDNGKQVSAIFKDKKNANKYNRNKAEDIKALLDLAKDTKYPNAIDESVVNEAKDMSFTDYLEVLDAKFEDAMAAVKGENGSDAEIKPTRGDILQNFTLFRNYISSLTKKYKGDKTKLRFLTECVDLNEAKKFKPGDKWSEDFDYDGMLAYALKVNEKTPLKTLQKLHDSATDVNYHTPFSGLGNAIDWITDDGVNSQEGKDFMKQFHNDIKTEMKN